MNAVPSGRNRDAAVKEVMRYAERHELEVMPERLSELPAYAMGLRSGRGVTETEKNGTAAKEVTALLEALWARDSEGTDG
jgi:2-hydroxychromene-2-carboxylate isomerase